MSGDFHPGDGFLFNLIVTQAPNVNNHQDTSKLAVGRGKRLAKMSQEGSNQQPGGSVYEVVLHAYLILC